MLNTEEHQFALCCRVKRLQAGWRTQDIQTLYDGSLPGTGLDSAPFSPFLQTDRARHDLSKMEECPSDTAALPTESGLEISTHVLF